MFKELLKLWNSTDLLTQAVNDSHEMLKLAYEMFTTILNEYIHGAKSNAEETGELIKKKDYLLNHYDRSIRKKIFEHMSLTEKEEQGIYTSFLLCTIVSDAERVGDYLKNLQEVFSNSCLKDEKMNKIVGTSFETIGRIFGNTITAYKTSDEDLAKKISDDYHKCKLELDDLMFKLLKEELTVQNPAAYILLFRYLKRIGSHLMTISTSVINPIDQIGYYIKS